MALAWPCGQHICTGTQAFAVNSDVRRLVLPWGMRQAIMVQAGASHERFSAWLPLQTRFPVSLPMS